MKDIFDVLKGPRLTEKGTALQEQNNQIVVKVASGSNKLEIKEAVEQLFKVKVAQVRTLNVHGKRRRVGRHVGFANDWKKAIITLAEGQKLDFLEGL